MKFKNQDELPEGGGSKNFLKLKDKESVQGIFRGDLHEFFVLWENGKSREVDAGFPGGKFRFRVNLVIKEGPSYVAKIFEQGLTVYNQLRELHEEYELDKIVVKITRNGTGTDTTYSVLPLLKQAISKETFKFLDSMELLPLEQQKREGAEASADSAGEVPF
jgi:hypothetical protein